MWAAESAPPPAGNLADAGTTSAAEPQRAIACTRVSQLAGRSGSGCKRSTSSTCVSLTTRVAPAPGTIAMKHARRRNRERDIQAIRTDTRMSLRDAKELAESMQRETHAALVPPIQPDSEVLWERPNRRPLRYGAAWTRIYTTPPIPPPLSVSTMR